MRSVNSVQVSGIVEFLVRFDLVSRFGNVGTT